MPVVEVVDVVDVFEGKKDKQENDQTRSQHQSTGAGIYLVSIVTRQTGCY